MPSIINRIGLVNELDGETGGDDRPVDADGNPIETKAAVPETPEPEASEEAAAEPE